MNYQYIKSLNDKIDSQLVFCTPSEVFCYEDEISGNQRYGKLLADISYKNSCLLVVRINTDLFGMHYSSLMIYENGELLGIFDEMNCFNSCEINIIDSKYGRFCILIESDILIDNIVDIINSFSPDFVFISVKDYLLESVYELNFEQNVFCLTNKELKLLKTT